MLKWLLVFLFAAQLCHAQSSSVTVFEAKVNKGDKIGSQWKLKAAKDCKPVIEASPKGGRLFIAKIPQGQQALAITKLPDHTHVRVQFDLILTGTWDGEHETCGPDSWKFDIDGREPLVNGSFCNNVSGKKQSFPDFLGSGYESNNQFTLALESSTLGYVSDEGVKKVISDSIYRFDFIIPHTKKSLQLNFESKFVDTHEETNVDQWYGLDNVKISALTNPKQETEEIISSKINALASRDAVTRYKARISLLASDQQFLKLLETHLKKKKNEDILKVVALLNDESFKIRTDATNKLLSLSKEHSQSIEQALHDATEPEIISRLRYIVSEGNKKGKPNHQTEIARVLRMIDTPQAKKLLQTRSLKFQ